MKTESIEEFLKRGGKIKQGNFRKAKGTEKYNRNRASAHMGMSKTHQWWSDKPKEIVLEQSING